MNLRSIGCEGGVKGATIPQTESIIIQILQLILIRSEYQKENGN